KDADLDRVLGLGRKCRRQAERQSRRGGKQAAAEWSLGDRANRCVHCDVLLLTRNRRLRAVRSGGIASAVPSPSPAGKPLLDLSDLTDFSATGRRPAHGLPLK